MPQLTASFMELCPKAPEVTPYNISQHTVRVISWPLNSYLWAHKELLGIHPFPNPYGARLKGDIEVFWYPRKVVQEHIDRFHDDPDTDARKYIEVAHHRDAFFKEAWAIFAHKKGWDSNDASKR